MSMNMEDIENFSRGVQNLHHQMWEKIMGNVNKQEHDKVLSLIRQSKNELSDLTNNLYGRMSRFK